VTQGVGKGRKVGRKREREGGRKEGKKEENERKRVWKPGTYNPSYTGSRDQGDSDLKPT
jgi:hypothetical protein